MFEYRKQPSAIEGLLSRPRIDKLLAEGLSHYITLVIAGPGYGKSSSVASFARGLTSRVVWLNLHHLDAIAHRFWQSFIGALEPLFPNLAVRLRNLDFPAGISQFDTFLSYLNAELSADEPLLLILDDCQNLRGREVREFFENLFEARVTNLRLVFISSTQPQFFAGSLLNPELIYTVSVDALSFTYEEMTAFFAQRQLSYSETALQEIYSLTGGWPLALFLLASHYQENGPIQDAFLDIENSLANELFETEFFAGFTADVQQILIRLSLFSLFPIEFIKEIGHADDLIATVETIQAIPFLSYDPLRQHYRFQRLYRSFLAKKQATLSEAEIRRVYTLAGDWFFQHQRPLEAIESYGQSTCYTKMLNAIRSLPNTRMSHELADFFLQQLESLPASFLEQNPIAEYLIAACHLNNLEIEKAEEMLLKLEQRCLLMRSHPRFNAALGEVYISLAAISMLRLTTDFQDYYRKAAACLPNGSEVQKKNQLIIDNSNILTIADERPGGLQRMEAAVFDSIDYSVHVFNGGGKGLQWLYASEAAYATLNYARAVECAYQAIFTAMENGQHDIICNARLMLAKMECVRGNYNEFAEQIFIIRDYINDRNLVALFGLRDYALGFFSMRMNDVEQIPPWILMEDDRTIASPMSNGRETLVRINYLLNQHLYAEIPDICRSYETLCQKRGMWSDLLHVRIFRAIAYQRLGENDSALDAFWQAYGMSYQNGILAHFIEGASFMRSLISLASRSDYPFDPDWLKELNTKTNTYTKQLSAMIKEHYGKNDIRIHTSYSLSKRESEVLLGLAQGLTRDEIAQSYSISINTVKSCIRNIYSKLGAVNRADAIRIATGLHILPEEPQP